MLLSPPFEDREAAVNVTALLEMDGDDPSKTNTKDALCRQFSAIKGRGAPVKDLIYRNLIFNFYHHIKDQAEEITKQFGSQGTFRSEESLVLGKGKKKKKKVIDRGIGQLL